MYLKLFVCFKRATELILLWCCALYAVSSLIKMYAVQRTRFCFLDLKRTTWLYSVPVSGRKGAAEALQSPFVCYLLALHHLAAATFQSRPVMRQMVQLLRNRPTVGNRASWKLQRKINSQTGNDESLFHVPTSWIPLGSRAGSLRTHLYQLKGFLLKKRIL